ncbi:hypothetical protein BUALT_Bualt05G0077400 [Buddleja alternifolia]|uniref:Uncharacterized protein n=1 Tax=Buddleja alternifolia TaxID=168488 RepID=A0AAV6XHJ6_9LAMI|nr:hypothetical protein BUALT_Bualt05G0077400 [Buddleja alternifolia]
MYTFNQATRAKYNLRINWGKDSWSGKIPTPKHTQIEETGYQVDQLKTGLGFALAEPVRIRVTKKENVSMCNIYQESNGKEKKPSDDRVSVFDRLSTPIARPSVFERLGSSGRIPNVQDRLGASSIPQSSVFNQLGGGSTQQLKKRNHAGETDMAGSRNNNQTLILSLSPKEVSHH